MALRVRGAQTETRKGVWLDGQGRGGDVALELVRSRLTVEEEQLALQQAHRHLLHVQAIALAVLHDVLQHVVRQPPVARRDLGSTSYS